MPLANKKYLEMLNEYWLDYVTRKVKENENECRRNDGKRNEVLQAAG